MDRSKYEDEPEEVSDSEPEPVAEPSAEEAVPSFEYGQREGADEDEGGGGQGFDYGGAPEEPGE